MPNQHTRGDDYPTSSTSRQRNIDTVRAVLCYYATDPVARPHCQLTAVVRYGPITLCATCAVQRPTLGKAQTPTPLPDTPPIDVLHWVSTALADLHNAERQLAAAVHRARQHGHPWSTLGNLLGITRQAAQQRFRPDLTLTTATKSAGGAQMNRT
jgi:hypothetical protein